MQRLAIILFLAFFSCSDSENIPGSNAVPPDHLEFFGFTLVDTYWDDPTDNESKTNYSDEVSPFTNIGDILVVTPEDTIVNRMVGMQQAGMKSILHVAELFFEQQGSNAPSGNNYSLRSDYQERWNVFSSINELHKNASLIAAFYLGEEPTWNGIVANELEKAADYIKATTPQSPIMIIEAAPAISNLTVPNSVDWVGFDHYFIKDPKNNAEYLRELQMLKTKLSPSQRLVLVLDSHYINAAHGALGSIALNDLKAVATSYHDLAKAEPKTIALLGYFWPNGFDSPNSIGARGMPSAVLAEYKRIGKEITGK